MCLSSSATWLKRFSGAACMVGLALLGGACERGAPAPERAGPTVVTEWRPLPTSQPASKQVGEACDAHGASECLEGQCVHARPTRGQGYVCSRPCQASAQCPPDWRCVPVVPGARQAVCLPKP